MAWFLFTPCCFGDASFDLVSYFVVDKPSNSRNVRSLQPWSGSLKELIAHKSYVAIGLLFICLMSIARFYPMIFAYLKAFWVSLAWWRNLGILGKWSQLLEQAQHVFDIMKLWSKLMYFLIVTYLYAFSILRFKDMGSI